MEEIQCIFCKTYSDRVFIEENGFVGKKCPSCDLVFISPRPTQAEIIELYKHGTVHMPPEAHMSGGFARRLFARHNLRIIRKHIKSGSILEIGSGGGFFLNEAKLAGFKPHGIELNPSQAAFIRARFGIPCEDVALHDGSFGGRKFDVIYHCDVISHFFDPIEDFRTAHRRLGENGLLVFETGNGDIDPKYLKYFESFQYPDHLFFFSERNLKDLLEMTGFRLIRIYRYSILPQLMIYKCFSKIFNFDRLKKSMVEANKAGISPQGSPAPARAGLRYRFLNALKNMFFSFIYIVRYKIGLLVRKKGRPQTLVVVAVKKPGPFV